MKLLFKYLWKLFDIFKLPDLYIPLPSIEELQKVSKKTGIPMVDLMEQARLRSLESARRGREFYESQL